MRHLVGVPFQKGGRSLYGADCWGLVCIAYKSLYNIELPHSALPVDAAISVQLLDGPEEGCLVRVVRQMPMAEHWGVYCAGYVLHAQHPSSAMIKISHFMRHHSRVEFMKVVTHE